MNRSSLVWRVIENQKLLNKIEEERKKLLDDKFQQESTGQPSCNNCSPKHSSGNNSPDSSVTISLCQLEEERRQRFRQEQEDIELQSNSNKKPSAVGHFNGNINFDNSPGSSVTTNTTPKKVTQEVIQSFSVKLFPRITIPARGREENSPQLCYRSRKRRQIVHSDSSTSSDQFKLPEPYQPKIRKTATCDDDDDSCHIVYGYD
jgi:hypothetical protein